MSTVKVEEKILGLTPQEFKLAVIIGSVALIMIIGVLIANYWMRMDKLKKEEKLTKFYNNSYRALLNFPLTKRYTRRCYLKIKDMAVTTESGVRTEAVKTALQGVGTFIGCCMVGLFLIENVVCKLLFCVLGCLMANRMLALKVHKINMRVLDKMGGFIGLVREEFLRCEDIVAALTEVDTPPELKRSVDRILDVMNSRDVEEGLAHFLEITYCSHIKTFAIACIKINDLGEEVVENKEPTFIKVLRFIEKDVNADYERRLHIKNKFGLLELTSLLPLIATDLLPKVLGNNMPGLNMIYNGISGYLIKVLLVLTGVAGYYVITVLGQLDGAAENDRIEFIENLVKDGTRIGTVAEKASPKKNKKHKLQKLMQRSLTKKSIRGLTLERIIISIATFVLTIVIMFIAAKTQGKYAAASTNTFGMIAANDTEAWSDEYIRAADEKIFEVMRERADGDVTKKAEELMTDEEIHSFVESSFSGLTELQWSDQVTRVKKKYDLINSAYFHWYFLLIAAGLSVVTFFIPIWLLKFRAWNIHKQEQEEFLGLQTLCTIIAISDSDVLDALENMYKMAKLYREKLLACYLSYCINPNLELERLYSRVELTDFKRLIKKLELATEDVSLKEAFEGMEIEREHIMNVREEELRKAINDRRNKAGLVSKISMGVLIVGLLIFPILYVGASELLKVFDALSELY